MGHGNPTGSRKEITVRERARRKRPILEASGVGGDRIKVAESDSVASRKIRKERGATPVSADGEPRTSKTGREGGDGYRGSSSRRVPFACPLKASETFVR
jgi:hypothetical protein